MKRIAIVVLLIAVVFLVGFGTGRRVQRAQEWSREEECWRKAVNECSAETYWECMKGAGK